MLRIIISYFFLLAMVSAFAPPTSARWGRLAAIRSSSLPPAFMAAPLEEVEDPKNLSMEASSIDQEGGDGESKPAAKMVYKNLARGGEVTEVPWVDPAMVRSGFYAC